MRLAQRERGAATRRGWWRWGAALLLLLGLAGGWLPQAPRAAANGGQTITVTSPLDTSGTPTICTLRDALTTANNPSAPVGGCVAAPDGGSGRTIAFDLGGDPDWTITLDSALPPVTVGVTLAGPGAARLTIRREATDQDRFRLLTFDTAEPVAISGVTLTGGDVSQDLGGAVAHQGGGALSIANSILRGNAAEYGGAGFFAVGTATVTDSTLSDNSAATYGGGFYTSGTATVTDSTIAGNTASYGGGFYANGTVIVTDSTVTSNSTQIGGGFYTSGTATVAGSTVSGNSATIGGGGFYADSAATVTASTLSGNSATIGSGGGFIAYGTVTVTGSTLSGNNATSGGGFSTSGTTTVTDSTFSGNTTTAGDGGGFVTSAGATVAGSTFSTNTVAHRSGQSPAIGGGFAAYADATVTSTTLTGNSATGAGGGFIAYAGATVTGSTLTGNSAGDGGGGFFAGVATTVTGSAITDNSARSGGGFLSTGTTTVTGSAIATNTATNGGGGFYSGAATTVTNSTISGNSAASAEGGGFTAQGTTSVTGSTLVGNSAPDGAGIKAYGTATVTHTIVVEATGATVGNCTFRSGFTDGGGNISTDATCVGSGTTSLPNTDPLLGPLTDNGGPTPTHALRAASPARGPADPATCAAAPTGGVDQRGVARPAGGPCDSGAYQSNTVIALAPATLPGGTIGAAYSQAVTASGGAAPYSFAVTGGALPAGLTFSSAGLLTGTPTAAGNFAFAITATDDLGYSGSREYTLTVARVAQTITFATPAGDPAYAVGDTFAVGATASSGLPVTFAVAGPCNLSGTTVTTTGAGNCVVTASQPGDATYGAAPDVARTFAIAIAPVTVAASASGGGTVSPSGASAHPTGSLATYTATPDAGQVFLGWTLDGQAVGFANPLAFTVTADRTLVATFVPRPTFADVAEGDARAEAIAQLAARGIVRGYADGRFGPADPLLRTQQAALIVRALGWSGEQPADPEPFSDLGAVDPELQRAVAILAGRGIINGYGDGQFGPADEIVHAQVISFVARAMVQAGYWTAVTQDDPTLYPNVPLSSGHRLDLLTYAQYAGAIPDRPITASWQDWDTAASRGWTAQVLWQALSSQFGVDRVP